MGFDANKANKDLLKELRKQDQEFLEQQRKQDEDFAKKYNEETMKQVQAMIDAKNKANASLKKGMNKANKETAKIIADSKTKLEKTLNQEFLDGTTLKVGKISVDKKSLKEFEDSAKQMSQTIDNVVKEVQGAKKQAREVEKILEGVNLDISLQSKVKKSAPKSSKKDQEYLTKLLTASVQLESEYNSMVKKVSDNTSGKNAIIKAQEYVNVMTETLDVVKKIKSESTDLINVNTIEGKIDVITTAMSRSGKIIERSLKPIETEFNKLIELKNNLKFSEDGIIGERPNKSNYTKKNLYQKTVDTDKYNIDKYLDWDSKNDKDSKTALEELLIKLRDRNTFRGDNKAKFVGLLSKALAEADLDINDSNFKLTDAQKQISGFITNKVLNLYRHLINKGASDNKEYDSNLEQLSIGIRERILSSSVPSTTASSVDPAKITQDHEKLVNILKKEKLEAEEIVSLFKEFSKLTQDEKNSISNILGDNKNLKNLLDLVQKTNGDLEKMKGLLGFVGGQGGNTSAPTPQPAKKSLIDTDDSQKEQNELQSKVEKTTESIKEQEEEIKKLNRSLENALKNYLLIGHSSPSKKSLEAEQILLSGYDSKNESSVTQKLNELELQYEEYMRIQDELENFTKKANLGTETRLVTNKKGYKTQQYTVGLSDLLNAIKSNYEAGNKDIAAKQFQTYVNRGGKVSADKIAGEFADNLQTYLHQANQTIIDEYNKRIEHIKNNGHIIRAHSIVLYQKDKFDRDRERNDNYYQNAKKYYNNSRPQKDIMQNENSGLNSIELLEKSISLMDQYILKQKEYQQLSDKYYTLDDKQNSAKSDKEADEIWQQMELVRAALASTDKEVEEFKHKLLETYSAYKRSGGTDIITSDFKELDDILSKINKNSNYLSSVDFVVDMQKISVFPNKDLFRDTLTKVFKDEGLNPDGSAIIVTNNSNNTPSLPLTEESSGQLALPIEGVKEASFAITKSQEEVQKEMRETNEVIKGQIELVEYLNSLQKEQKIKDMQSSIDSHKQLIEHLNGYTGGIKLDENMPKKEAWEYLQRAAKQYYDIINNPQNYKNDQLALEKATLLYDNAYKQAKLSKVAESRIKQYGEISSTTVNGAQSVIDSEFEYNYKLLNNELIDMLELKKELGLDYSKEEEQVRTLTDSYDELRKASINYANSIKALDNKRDEVVSKSKAILGYDKYQIMPLGANRYMNAYSDVDRKSAEHYSDMTASQIEKYLTSMSKVTPKEIDERKMLSEYGKMAAYAVRLEELGQDYKESFKKVGFSDEFINSEHLSTAIGQMKQLATMLEELRQNYLKFGDAKVALNKKLIKNDFYSLDKIGHGFNRKDSTDVYLTRLNDNGFSQKEFDNYMKDMGVKKFEKYNQDVYGQLSFMPLKQKIHTIETVDNIEEENKAIEGQITLLEYLNSKNEEVIATEEKKRKLKIGNKDWLAQHPKSTVSTEKSSMQQEIEKIAEAEQKASEEAQKLANIIVKAFGVKSRSVVGKLGFEIDDVLAKLKEANSTGMSGDEFDIFMSAPPNYHSILDVLAEDATVASNAIGSAFEDYDKLREAVSKSTIKNDPTFKSEFGNDWHNIRNTIGSTVIKNDSGTDIMVFLGELNDTLGTTFDLTTSAQDGITQLYEALKNGKQDKISLVADTLAADGSLEYIQSIIETNQQQAESSSSTTATIVEGEKKQTKATEDTTHAIEAQTEAIENNTKAKEKNNQKKSKGYDFLEHASFASEDVERMLQKVIDNSGDIPRDKAKTSVTSSADGTITGGTITYVDDALKRTVTEVYSLKTLTDGMAEATDDVMESEQALVLLYKKATDDGIARAKQEEKAREKEKKDLDEIHAKQLKYQGEIDRAKREALEHATRPIRTQDRIAEANTAHENLTDKINTYLGDGVISVSKSALQEIETAIADYKALVNRLQSKDNVPTMATTDFENKKAQSIAKIEGLITELQQAGNYTSDLRKEADDLWVKLNEVGSGDELLPLSKAIGTISEKFRALRKEHDAEIQKQKEIQNQYNENIKVIRQLETETDKLNNMMASDVGKGRMSNQIEAQFNKTVEAAENAKKAIQDVNQMFTQGRINAGQHADAGKTYREAKQGSTASQARYEDAKASEAKAQAAKNEKAAVDNLKESLKNLISAYTQLTSVSTKPGENSFMNALEQAQKSRAAFGNMYKAAQDAGVNSDQLLSIQQNALVKLNESVSQSGAKAFDSYIAKIEEAMNRLSSLDRLTEEARNEFSELARKLNEANVNKDLSSLDGIDKYIQTIAKYSSVVDEEVKRIFQGSQIGSFQTQIAELDQLSVKSTRFTSLLGEVKQRLKEFNDFKEKTSDKQLISEKEVQLIKQLSPMINDLYKHAQGKGNLVPESVGKVTDITQLEQAMNNYATSLGYTKQVGQITRNGNDQLTMSFVNGNNEVLKITGSIDSLNQALRQTSVVAKNTGGFITNLKASFKQMVGYFTRYYTGYMMMTRAISSFKKGIGIVKEFDAAMTELHKVSNDTEQALARFGKEAFNIAETIGSTGKEIINSAADWEKLGYAIEDASELARNSALYSNVGDMDIDTATEHMVSTLKAYQDFDAQSSSLIVDKFNEIGNNYAITSEGIGSALERAASTLVAANNDLDQSIALITAGNIITQDPESVGNAIKVVSMRLRGKIVPPYMVTYMLCYKNIDDNYISQRVMGHQRLRKDLYYYKGERNETIKTISLLFYPYA